MDFWAQVRENNQIKNNNKRTMNTTEESEKKVEDINNIKATISVKDKNEIYPNASDEIDVVIITAVDDEYEAISKVFNNNGNVGYENGFKIASSFLMIEDKKVSTIVSRQKNMGLVSGAILATNLICKYKPKLILMGGICAGVKGKVNLGDLIISSPVYDYGAGKYTDGIFYPDYRQRALHENIRHIVEEMSEDRNLCRKLKDTWLHNIGKPQTELKVHIQPTGSGAAVIADESVLEGIRNHQRTLIGIDMEAYAIAEAACQSTSRDIPWMIVKGVQDYANPFKNDEFREYAAQMSAYFLREFVIRYFA